MLERIRWIQKNDLLTGYVMNSEAGVTKSDEN